MYFNALSSSKRGMEAAICCFCCCGSYSSAGDDKDMNQWKNENGMWNVEKKNQLHQPPMKPSSRGGLNLNFTIRKPATDHIRSIQESTVLQIQNVKNKKNVLYRANCRSN